MFSFERGPAPLKPRVEIKVMIPRKIGSFDEPREVNAETRLVGTREFTVSIQCFADDESASDMALALVAALEQPQHAEILDKDGVEVSVIHPVVDLSDDLDVKFERRVVMEFNIYVVSNAPFSGGQIDKVTIVGAATGSVGEHVITAEAERPGD
jgi:hypothetical protein